MNSKNSVVPRDKLADVIAKVRAATDFDHRILDRSDICRILDAASLLLEVHQDIDQGNVDGVDLEWLCRADECVMGDEE